MVALGALVTMHSYTMPEVGDTYGTRSIWRGEPAPACLRSEPRLA